MLKWPLWYTTSSYATLSIHNLPYKVTSIPYTTPVVNALLWNKLTIDFPAREFLYSTNIICIWYSEVVLWNIRYLSSEDDMHAWRWVVLSASHPLNSSFLSHFNRNGRIREIIVSRESFLLFSTHWMSKKGSKLSYLFQYNNIDSNTYKDEVALYSKSGLFGCLSFALLRPSTTIIFTALKNHEVVGGSLLNTHGYRKYNEYNQQLPHLKNSHISTYILVYTHISTMLWSVTEKVKQLGYLYMLQEKEDSFKERSLTFKDSFFSFYLIFHFILWIVATNYNNVVIFLQLVGLIRYFSVFLGRHPEYVLETLFLVVYYCKLQETLHLDNYKKEKCYSYYVWGE